MNGLFQLNLTVINNRVSHRNSGQPPWDRLTVVAAAKLTDYEKPQPRSSKQKRSSYQHRRLARSKQAGKLNFRRFNFLRLVHPSYFPSQK